MRYSPLLALLLGLAAPGLAQEQLPGARKPLAEPGRGDDAGSGGVRAVVPTSGEGLYRAICQACHMANAQGGEGAARIPALANNPRLVAAAYPITLVAKGRGAMPGFADTLTPAQIAEVVGYVCTHFGNSCKGPITAAEVVRIGGPFPAPPVGKR